MFLLIFVLRQVPFLLKYSTTNLAIDFESADMGEILFTLITMSESAMSIRVCVTLKRAQTVFLLTFDNSLVLSIRRDLQCLNFLEEVQKRLVMARIAWIFLTIKEEATRAFGRKARPHFVRSPYRMILTPATWGFAVFVALPEEEVVEPYVAMFEKQLQFLCDVWKLLLEFFLVHSFVHHNFLDDVCLLLMQMIIFILLSLDFNLATCTGYRNRKNLNMSNIRFSKINQGLPLPLSPCDHHKPDPRVMTQPVD